MLSLKFHLETFETAAGRSTAELLRLTAAWTVRVPVRYGVHRSVTSRHHAELSPDLAGPDELR